MNAFRRGKHTEKSNIRKAVLVTFAVILASAAVFAGAAVVKGVGFLKNISREDEAETIVMSVYVLNDSGIETLEETSSGIYGIAEGADRNNTDLVVKELQSYFGPLKVKSTRNLEALAGSLYDKSCTAIILNEASVSILGDSYPDFTEDARAVWSMEIPMDYDFSQTDADVTEDSFNVLISGSDTRGDISETGLSDVNMIATINPVTKVVLLTSIPRDSYVEMSSAAGEYDKLTHTGTLGISETMGAVEKLTGIKIDYYVKVNFSALVYVVDALGGIDIESDTDFVPWTNRSLHIKKGLNHMDGVTALAYARERYAYSDGDVHRAANQRQVLREIVWKATSPQIIKSYSRILDALSKGMETSMSYDDMKKLIRMQLKNPVQWDIQGSQVTGRNSEAESFYTMGRKKLSIVIPDKKSVRTAVEKIEKVKNGIKLDV